MASAPIRIGNASGFYGDRFSAMREMLEGGPLDVLTGDYLAELTMLILGRDRMKDARLGYARTFLRQMDECLAMALAKGVKIVVNAGGLNPAGLAQALRDLGARVGLSVRVAHVEGDDLLARALELGFGAPITANAYLGARGIATCLEAGADVVVTGRVTDASLVVGAAAHHFGWAWDAWDALAGATAAGHVIECSTQATGGNFSFFTELPRGLPGCPIAEVYADGSSVITKHDGTGGAVTVETVAAQLLYEITGARYAGPDVTTRFDSIELREEAPNRVRLSGVRGEPPPPTLKVSLNFFGGYRNEVTFVLTGLDIDEKANLAKEQLTAALGRALPRELVWSLYRTSRDDADTEDRASSRLRCVAKDADADVVGRAFSNAAVETALSSYPGFHLTTPPREGAPYGVFKPAYVDAKLVPHVAILSDGSRREIPSAPDHSALEEVPAAPLPQALPSSPTATVPIGRVLGARSGDKGGSANVALWARSDAGWRWLAHAFTVEEIKRLLPEAAPLQVTRHDFPNLRAVNFVIDGLLGEGVASSTRFDPQAKALGEWLRARCAPIPLELLPPEKD